MLSIIVARPQCGGWDVLYPLSYEEEVFFIFYMIYVNIHYRLKIAASRLVQRLPSIGISNDPIYELDSANYPYRETTSLCGARPCGVLLLRC